MLPPGACDGDSKTICEFVVPPGVLLEPVAEALKSADVVLALEGERDLLVSCDSQEFHGGRGAVSALLPQAPHEAPALVALDVSVFVNGLEITEEPLDAGGLEDAADDTRPGLVHA